MVKAKIIGVDTIVTIDDWRGFYKVAIIHHLFKPFL